MQTSIVHQRGKHQRIKWKCAGSRGGGGDGGVNQRVDHAAWAGGQRGGAGADVSDCQLHRRLGAARDGDLGVRESSQSRSPQRWPRGHKKVWHHDLRTGKRRPSKHQTKYGSTPSE